MHLHRQFGIPIMTRGKEKSAIGFSPCGAAIISLLRDLEDYEDYDPAPANIPCLRSHEVMPRCILRIGKKSV